MFQCGRQVPMAAAMHPSTANPDCGMSKSHRPSASNLGETVTSEIGFWLLDNHSLSQPHRVNLSTVSELLDAKTAVIIVEYSKDGCSGIQQCLLRGAADMQSKVFSCLLSMQANARKTT